MSKTSKLEARTLTIIQHENVWQELEKAAQRDGKTLDDYLHDLLLDTAAENMSGQAIVLSENAVKPLSLDMGI